MVDDTTSEISPHGNNGDMSAMHGAFEHRSKVLPRLPQLHPGGVPLDFRGPTPWSNYIIQGRVLAGAYPATISDEETHGILRALLKVGVTTFVCLQAEYNNSVSDMSWKMGKTLRPYIKDAQRMIMDAKKAREGDTAGNDDLKNIHQTRLDLLHLPIVDGSVTSDGAISDLADDCCQRILRGERLYIHCWGGHGRTGSLVALILSRLYGMTALDALHYTQKMHDVRVASQNTASPQTRAQILQVLRIISQSDPKEYSEKFSWPHCTLLPFTALEEQRWLKKIQQDPAMLSRSILKSSQNIHHDNENNEDDSKLIKSVSIV